MASGGYFERALRRGLPLNFGEVGVSGRLGAFYFAFFYRFKGFLAAQVHDEALKVRHAPRADALDYRDLGGVFRRHEELHAVLAREEGRGHCAAHAAKPAVERELADVERGALRPHAPRLLCQCDRYRQECGECPFLYGKKHKHDLANRVFRQKKEIYTHYPITFVTCSHWLEEQARQSALTVGRQIVCIPNPLNTNLFRPHNKQMARQRLQLPMDRKLILFGAFKITDKRKGIDYMVDACKLLAGQHPELKEQMAVVTFGRQSAQVAEMLPFKVYPLDYVNDEHRLVDMYNAADLFVTPSLEENLPNTIMEAMACGTPCVGFNVGGIPEMIDHLHNGYVAIYKSADDFANGIYWALTEPDYDSLCEQACRKAVSHYSEDSVTKRYIDLYNKLTERR